MVRNGLKSKTIVGLLWSFTELISKQGIQLIVQIFLARLLLPEHFGLIGMITIFVAISTAFVQSGLDQALIREKQPKQEDYATVFYFNLIISIIIYVIMYSGAPLIANFFNEPQLIDIVRVIMIVVIINAFSIIQRVILIRKIDFKTQTKISIIAGIISGVSAITMAMMGFGVWSLVFQQVVMKLIETLLLIFSIRWMPSVEFNFFLFKKYFNFGYKLLLSGLIDTIYKNIYFVIIGKFYPAAQLGYFTNATRIRDISSQSVTQAIQKVTYPVLSNIQEDNARLATNYKKLLQMTAFLYFPFMFGASAVAPNFIPLLLGEQWIPSIVFFQLLCIAGIFYPIQSINLNILKVKNRSDLFLFLEIIKKIVLSILITIAVIMDFGIEGLILAAIIHSFISLFINTYYSGREIDYSTFKQVQDLFPSFLLALLMAFIVYNLDSFFNMPLVGSLLLQFLIGFVFYATASWLLKMKEFKITLNLIKSMKKN